MAIQNFETEIKRNEVKTITVTGRRWFQKSYGNTYNTVTVYVNNDEVFQLEPEYGYGSYYFQRAEELLQKLGLVDLKPNKKNGLNKIGLRQYCDKRGISLVDEVSDVGRERDL